MSKVDLVSVPFFILILEITRRVRKKNKLDPLLLGVFLLPHLGRELKQSFRL